MTVQLTPAESRFLYFYGLQACSNDFHLFGEFYFIRLVGWRLTKSGNIDLVRDILQLAKDTPLDLWELLAKKYSDFDFASIHTCLRYSPTCFALVVEYGGTSKMDAHAIASYMDGTIDILYKKYDEVPMARALMDFFDRSCDSHEFIYNPLNLLSFQLLFLFVSSTHENLDYLPSDFENALQLLWSCIPDTLLTITEYTRCFQGLNPRCMPDILEAWNWYCRLVKNEEGPEKCPRSLKHLSRCAIREKLKGCSQLPDGVEKLNIPKSFKKYLLLKDFSRMN